MGPKSGRRRWIECVQRNEFPHARVIFYACVVAVWQLTTLTAEDKPKQATVDSAEPLVVKLVEGAKSPRAAVESFVAASQAGDVEATLLLIDPQYRPVVQTEVLLEEFILERHLLRNLVMNDEQRRAPWNNLGAFPVVYAKRDLMRTSQIEIRKERPSTVGEDRRLLDVTWKVHSWHPVKDDRFDYVTTTILAVRRENRWYLFHPFGTVFVILRGAEELGYSDENMALKSERREEDDPQTDGTDFVIEYQVPIEVVHEGLVGAAQSPSVANLLKNAQQLVRFQNGLKNQSLRGDFETLKDLEAALDKGDPALEALLVHYLACFKPAVNNLLQNQNEQPAKE